MQIDLISNSLGFLTGNNLNADLTGDGNADLLFAVAMPFPTNAQAALNTLRPLTQASIYYHYAFASRNPYGNFVVRLPDDYSGNKFFTGTDNNPPDGRTLFSIFFQDSKFNSGAKTNAFLELHGYSASGPTNNTIAFARLALLALGAGGILMRRRRKKETVAA